MEKIKFYQVVFIFKNNEECFYEGYDLESAIKVYENNMPYFAENEIEIREYNLSKVYDDFSINNDEFMNEYISIGYDLIEI